MSRKPTATHADLVRTLSYNPETGRFGLRPLMTKVGRGSPGGYVYIRWGGRDHPAHRLAWFYVHGEFPSDGMHLDHINGDKADNRIANLRLATASENGQNRKAPNRGTASGLLGVSVDGRGRWSARIIVGGDSLWLGRFDTPGQAHAAYLAAKSEAHPFASPLARSAA